MRRPTSGATRALAIAAVLAGAGGCGMRVWEIRPEPAARALRGLAGEVPLGHADRVSVAAQGPSTPAPPSPRLAKAAGLVEDARHLEGFSRQRALFVYRECMILALDEVHAAGDSNDGRAAQVLYNRALSRFLRLGGRHHLQLDDRWLAMMAEHGLPVAFANGPGLWNPGRFDEVRFAGDYLVRGADRYHGTEGLGVPVMAIRKPTRERLANRQGADRFLANEEVYPATVVLRFPAGAAETSPAVLELLDPLEVDRVDLGGRLVPLAADLTTPTAYQFAHGRIGRYDPISILTPRELTVEAGLHMLHPYQRGKIPIVMTHGMGSGERAWGKVVNELRGDPELRAHYQFWLYVYNTVNPFVLSAAQFRRSLAAAREAVDPGHTDPAYDQMVLIGHSMGGLMSRQAITDSGDALWRLNSSRPIETLEAPAEDRELIARVFFFRPLPFVRRVVFIATPHRGTRLASNPLGRIGDSFIRFPTPLERSHAELLAHNDRSLFTPLFLAGVPSNIDTLGLNNPYLTAVDRLPPAPGVKAHTIVGKVGHGPLESSSDGVVTYSSSHINWAVSEYVVPTNHFCQDDERTIEELRRILRQHLRSLEFGAEAGPP
ncbi:MAG: esterase/lipase family protein [Isosphaeraceae bacterium]